MDDFAVCDREGQALAACRQVAELIGKTLILRTRWSADGYAFRLVADGDERRSGILAVEGRYDSTAAAIQVSCLLLRVRPEQRAGIGDVLGAASGCLSSLSNKGNLQLSAQADGTLHVSVTFAVQATPLSCARVGGLVGQLTQLHECVKAWQGELPDVDGDPALETLYEKSSTWSRSSL